MRFGFVSSGVGCLYSFEPAACGPGERAGGFAQISMVRAWDRDGERGYDNFSGRGYFGAIWEKCGGCEKGIRILC